MAGIINQIDGNSAIQDTYTTIYTNDYSINQALSTLEEIVSLIESTYEDHVADLSDNHKTSGIVNDSTVSDGNTGRLKGVVENLQSQITALVIGGTDTDPRLTQALVDFENTDWTSLGFKALQDFWQSRIVELEKYYSNATAPPETVTNQSPTVSFDLNNGGVTPVISGSGSTITQECYDGNFEYGTDGWGSTALSFISSDGVASFIANSQNGQIFNSIINSGGDGNQDKWAFLSSVKSDSNKINFSHYGANIVYHTGSGNFERLVTIRDSWVVGADDRLQITDTRASGWTTVQVKDCMAINLGQPGQGGLYDYLENLGLTTDTQKADYLAQLDYTKGTQNLSDLKFEITSDTDPDFKNEVYAPVTLTSKDNYTIEGGKMFVDRNVRVIESLDGIDYDWVFFDDRTGHKRISINGDSPSDRLKSVFPIVTKYNGKNIPNGDSGLNADVFGEGDWNGSNGLTLSILDIDSGFGESHSPSDDECKALMNMWVTGDENGDLWMGVGTQTWWKRYQGIGTPLTLPTGTVVEDGTDITVVPQEKAYGDITECYKIQYDLAEPVQEEIDLIGDMTMPEGKAYVTVESGVRFEKVVPTETLDSASEQALGFNVVNLPTGYKSDSPFSKKVDSLLSLIVDLNGTKIDLTSSVQKNVSNGYGKERYFILEEDLPTGVNADSDFYAEYKTLSSENNTNLFDMQVTYKDELINVIDILGQKLAYQAKQLDIAEMRIEELTKVEEYEPTLLNGTSAIVCKVSKKADEVRIYIRALQGAVSSPTDVFKIPKSWCKDDLVSFKFVPSNFGEYAHLTIFTDGTARVYFNTPTTLSGYFKYDVR